MIAGKRQTVSEWTLNSSKIRPYALQNAYLPETVTFPNATEVGNYAFANTSRIVTLNCNAAETFKNKAISQSSVVTINAESLKTIERYGLDSCYKLTTLNAPNVTTLESCAINDLQMVTELYFPNLVNLGSQAISLMRFLTKLTLGDVRIQASSFDRITPQVLDVKTSSSIYIPKMLSKALIIRDITAVPTMENTVAELKETLNVYVPDDLVDAFKAATNWSAFGDRIKPLSTYVES